MITSILFGCSVVLAATPPWCLEVQAAPREIMLQHGTFGLVPLLAPSDEPKAFIVYLVDGDLNPVRRVEAERIADLGAAVVSLSTQDVIHKIEAGTDRNADCYYALGEFEDLSTSAQRALGSASYRWPVLFGNGTASGTFAYLTIAQAPANTASGAVSIGFGTSLVSNRPLCPGARASANPLDGFTYLPPAALPGDWVLIASAEPPSETMDFVSKGVHNTLQIVRTGPTSQFDAGVQAALDMGSPPAAALSDLPIVEIKANTQTEKLAIFLSGDGGWRDLDKTIAEAMSENGINVVGLDSLRYFWKRKDPSQVAHDLERMIAHYRQHWQSPHVVLLGYSMGADIIPPAWSKLSERARDAIGLIVLIGAEPTALYEVSIAGYLGVTASDEVDIRPDLKKLPVTKVMCFYGKAEQDDGNTACTLPELNGATLIERPGGHHLDGNYDAMVRDILARVNTMP
jgi:type IV secretory pathway VirJ component